MPPTPTPQWETNADEFRCLAATISRSSWAAGWEVARSVTKDANHGRPSTPENVSAETFSPEPVPHEDDPNRKCSAREFARRGGTSPTRVLRILEAWNLAAEQGLVPHSTTLLPNSPRTVSLESLPDWSHFYPPGGTDYQRMKGEQKERVDQVAEEMGVPGGQIARVASSTKAFQAAIKANPALVDVALEAMAESEPEVVKEALKNHPQVRTLSTLAEGEMLRATGTPRSSSAKAAVEHDEDQVEDKQDARVDLLTALRKARTQLNLARTLVSRADLGNHPREAGMILSTLVEMQETVEVLRAYLQGDTVSQGAEDFLASLNDEQE